MGLIGLKGIGQKERIALNRRSENNQGKHSLQKKNKTVTSDDCSQRKNQPFYILLCAEGGEGRKKSFHIFMCVLSTHTVMSHRKNIARKLNIHSTAGLTIYAIVNGIVEIDSLDIKN